MITAAQLKAARALAGMDQRMLAEASGLSLPTIQRMESSDGTIRGNVDSLVKLITALEAAALYRELKSLMAEDAARRKAATQFRSDNQPGTDGPGKFPEPSRRSESSGLMPSGRASP